MASLVGTVVALSIQLRQAVEGAPLLTRRCDDISRMVDQVSQLAQQLEAADNTPEGSRYFRSLQKALTRALALVQKGQGKGMKTRMYLITYGDVFGKELEYEFQNIQMSMTGLNLLNAKQIAGVAATTKETNALCKELEASQQKVVQFLGALVQELSLQRKEMFGLAHELARAIDNGSASDRRRVKDGLINLISNSSSGPGDHEQLRNELHATREEGLGPLASLASVSEYEPGEKPGPQDELLLDSILAEHFRNLEELSEAKKLVLEKEVATELLQKETERLEAEKASLEGVLAREEGRWKQLSNELEDSRRILNDLAASTKLSKEVAEFFRKLDEENRGRRSVEIRHKDGHLESSASAELDNYPSFLICVVCKEPMNDAVVIDSGYSCCQHCARGIVESGHRKCPISNMDIYNSGTANHNLRQAKSHWEGELTAWIREKEAALLGVTSLSSPHSDGASTSGSEGAQARPVEPIELLVKGFNDADLKEPELIDQVQKIVEGVEERDVAKMVTGTAGLRDLLEAKRGRWKQVYNAGGVKPLIGVLKIPEARSSAIVVLGLIMDEAVIEAYQKDDGDKVAKDACENIAVGAGGGLAQILNDKDAERQEKAKAAAILGHCCKVSAIRDLMLRSKTGIVLGLVKLSALRMHDEDPGDGSFQELSRGVLCQLAEIPPVEIAEQDGVVRPLLEFSRSQWTRIEALRSLSWLCAETEDELGVGWVAEAVLAKGKGTALLTILPEALDTPDLRLPMAQCLARLCQSESLARQLSRTATRRGTGFEVVLKLLGTVLSVEEGRQPAREVTEGIPPEDHRLCASYLVRIVMSVANADGEWNRVLILERGVDLLLRALRMDDPPSGAVTLSVARAFEALTKIPHFAEPIVSVGGVSGIAVLLHQDIVTAEAALEALSNLVDTCPETAITALRGADGALAQLNCLLTARGLSCRNAAMKLLLLLEERGNEECSVDLAETVSLKALKPWKMDGVEYKRAASTLGAAMSRHWSDKEDVLRGISLVRGELESALKWQASGDRPTAQPQNLSPDNVKVAQAALAALSAMIQRGNHATLLLEAVFPKLAFQSQSPKQPPPLWIVLTEALGSGSGPVSLEAARFVALLFESIEADDQEAFVASGVLIEPLLDLMTDKAGGEEHDGSGPPLDDSGDVTNARATPQSWAHRALEVLVTANLLEPVFRDDHVTALIQCVTEGPDLPYPIRLLHVISGIPDRRPHVRDKGLVPVISVVRSSDGAERTTALRILRRLAKDAPAAYAAASADATAVLVEVLGAPRATRDDREIAASAIDVLAEEATGLTSLATHVPALLIPLGRPETGEREAGSVLRVLGQLGLVGDFKEGGLIGNEGLVEAILCALRASKETEEGYHNRRLCVALLNQFVKCRRSEHVGEKIHATRSVEPLSRLLVTNGADEGFLADSAAYLLTNCVATSYPGDCAGVMEPLRQLLKGTVGSYKCSHHGLALAEALFKNGNEALRLSLASYCLSPLESLQNLRHCPASETAKAVAKSKGKGKEKMIDLPCGNTCVRRTRKLVDSLQKVERDSLRKR